jgi:MGT family glycosyltransferase
MATRSSLGGDWRSSSPITRRFLFVLWDGGGNVAPQLAVARELAGRGHQVRVLGSASLRDRAVSAGAAFTPFTRAPDFDPRQAETDLLRDWETRTPLGAFARARDNLLCGPAERFAEDVVEQLESEPADVAAVDFMLFGASIGAQAAGVPAAAMFHTVYAAPAAGIPPYGTGLLPAKGLPGRLRDTILSEVSRRLFAPGFKTLNAVATRYGLPPVRDFAELLDRIPLALVLSSPAFDFAASAFLPRHVRYVGPALERTEGSRGWESPWPGDHPAPLVAVSFSTNYMNQRGLAERVLAALDGLPVRGVLTTGPALDVSGIPIPTNVIVRDWVPHHALFSDASLVITHAGLGTVHAALAAGAPLLCLPCGRDQADNAARAIHAGCGVRLPAGASSARLRRTIQTALSDHELRGGAQHMAQTFAREDGATNAANALERLAGGEP